MYDIPFPVNWLEDQIVAYEQEPIEKGKILFYGHSLFTRWGSPKWGYRRLDADIRRKDGSLACINHGFGTSTSEELLYYYHRMVRPWEPQALVIASFANDGMYGYDVQDIMHNIGKLCSWARTDFPGIQIFLLEDHPRPSHKGATVQDVRNNALQRRERYHKLLRLYAACHDDTTVVELWNRPDFFETPEGVGDFRQVRDDLFVSDRVHPNQAGYDVFRKIFLEVLDELL